MRLTYLCSWLLPITLGLTACSSLLSPIIIDRMPCAGDIYFAREAQQRFQPWRNPRLSIMVEWMNTEGFNGPDGIGIVLRGLCTSEGWTRPLSEAELALICQRAYVPDEIPDSDRIRVQRFLPPAEGEQMDVPYQQTFRLPNPSKIQPYRSDPIDQIEINFVEFGHDYYWIKRVTRDTVPILKNHDWEVVYTETDPCYEPPRRYFLERYRERGYVD